MRRKYVSEVLSSEERVDYTCRVEVSKAFGFGVTDAKDADKLSSRKVYNLYRVKGKLRRDAR